MRQNQVELQKEYEGLALKYRELMPDVGAAYRNLAEVAYKDGALPAKIKRMMGLVAALSHGCVGCILYQTQEAIAQGATADEILEACGVATSIGGTMATAATTHVTKLLQDRDMVK